MENQFLKAIMDKDLAKVNRLILLIPNLINVKTSNGANALHFACDNEDADV